MKEIRKLLNRAKNKEILGLMNLHEKQAIFEGNFTNHLNSTILQMNYSKLLDRQRKERILKSKLNVIEALTFCKEKTEGRVKQRTERVQGI